MDVIQGSPLADPVLSNTQWNVWFMSIAAAALVGFTGVLPILLWPQQLEETNKNKKLEGSNKSLRLMLSFAVGGLLGDVFLHLLPEAWNFVQKSGASAHAAHLDLGISVVSGISVFVAIEMMFTISSKDWSDVSTQSDATTGCNTKQVAGYLNLLANGIDNFTHGLAVAASFLVGVKIGVLTTFAIIIHEVPHEFGDFVILMRSGFSKWEAVKAQGWTASIGIIGALVALSAESAESLGVRTAWILPFTAGGFLHIAMVSILPDIVKEDNAWESMKQLFCLGSGIGVMALVNCLAE